MSPYIKLGLCTLIPIAASVLLFLADKKSGFAKLSYWKKQIIIGLVFGLIAVSGTEFGVRLDGLTLNVRDAAPVCAGLIFGAPAGIISGLIGGVERWFAALWGAGMYTRVSCSVATVLAGLFAGWLRVYLFESRRPSWIYALATGVIAEAMHIVLMFVTHASDPVRSFSIVQMVAIPQLFFTGLAAMLSVLLVELLDKEGRTARAKGIYKISHSFQRRLLSYVLIAFVITSLFSFVILNAASESKVDTVLELSLSDIRKEVTDGVNSDLLTVTRSIAKELNSLPKIGNGDLVGIASRYNLSEVNVILQDGIVRYSSDTSSLNYNMRSGAQSMEFLDTLLYGDKNEFVQDFQERSQGSGIMRKYAGVTLRNGGFVQASYNTYNMREEIEKQVIESVSSRHVGETGFLIVCDDKMNIIYDPQGLTDQKLEATGLNAEKALAGEGSRFSAKVYGEKCYCMCTKADTCYIFAAMPKAEATFTRDAGIYFSTLMEALIFTALFIVLYFLTKHQVVDNIHKINSSLSEITNGNLDVTVDVRTHEEFAALSDDINSTVDTLKRYIGEAEERIAQELRFAHTIQHSALPSIFPPYPNRSEFDIWAGMYAAKEVGGDFYDFYMLGEDRLAFIIADVSGKGIPAAMFMMNAKSLLKSHTEIGSDADKVFALANEELCKNNEAGMFVTAWMGIIDLKTGLVTYVNAGHNPPLLKKKDGRFEYLRSRTGFVLAGMEGIKYKKLELQLQPGDTLYLYTDGVTEATNADTVLYGEERLRSCLNSLENADAEAVCRAVKADVDAFVGEAPQFDDITMMCFTYKGPAPEVKELTVKADIANMDTVVSFVDNELEAIGCPPRTLMQINIVIDEIFNNIASYAYHPENGSATVRIEQLEDSVKISFIDSGVEFDPLRKPDPDITLSAEERQIGGLGIFMVKKIMDDVQYERKDGMNILTVRKKV